MRGAEATALAAQAPMRWARTVPARPVQEGWTLTLGVAPVAAPAWQGSKESSFSIYPDVRINYGDAFYASVPEGMGWNALNSNGWKAGPQARLRFARDENDGGSPFLVSGGSNALLGMGDVPATVEMGGVVEKRLGDRRQWQMRAEVRQGIGGHKGIVADVSMSYRTNLGRTALSFGPRATLASKQFMQSYFGVDATQARTTGLDEYEADGGLVAFGLGGSVLHPLDQHSALTLFSGVEWLGSESADSSLVRERGQRTQFTAGLGYGYRFRL